LRRNSASHATRALTRDLFRALLTAVGYGLLLTPKAFWSRIRARRSPFSPTFYERRRVRPKAPLAGRPPSTEPYLRPTSHCNSHALEIIALADDFRRSAASDWEYARAVYDFTRNEIAHAVEPVPRRGVVGTLEMGTGVCMDKLHLFVALARAGGIPARYCAVGNLAPLESEGERPRLAVSSHYLKELEARGDWRLNRIGARFGRLVEQFERASLAGKTFEVRYHPMAEVKAGGSWFAVDPSWSDAQAAGAGLPLPRIGYDPLILRLLTGNVLERSEEYPMGRLYRLGRFLQCALARGLIDHVNLTFEADRIRGQQLLAEIGEDEYIRRMRRFYVPIPGATQLAAPFLAPVALGRPPQMP